MRHAELTALASQTATETNDEVSTHVKEIPNARASYVWLPLLVLGLVLAWMLVPLGFPFGRISGADFRAGLSTAYIAAGLSLVGLMAFYG